MHHLVVQKSDDVRNRDNEAGREIRTAIVVIVSIVVLNIYFTRQEYFL